MMHTNNFANKTLSQKKIRINDPNKKWCIYDPNQWALQKLCIYDLNQWNEDQLCNDPNVNRVGESQNKWWIKNIS